MLVLLPLSGVNKMASLWDWLTHPLDNTQAAWEDAVTRWQSAVADFDSAIQLHWDNYDKAKELGELDEWQSQLNRANAVQAAIESLQTQLKSVSSWYQQTFGNMQAIPLIPIAVITGSISAVVAITYALYSYNDQLQKKWDYINTHDVTPQQANDILENSGGGGGALSDSLGEIKGLAIWILIGGLLLKFGPKLLEHGRGSK